MHLAVEFACDKKNISHDPENPFNACRFVRERKQMTWILRLIAQEAWVIIGWDGVCFIHCCVCTVQYQPLTTTEILKSIQNKLFCNKTEYGYIQKSQGSNLNCDQAAISELCSPLKVLSNNTHNQRESVVEDTNFPPSPKQCWNVSSTRHINELQGQVQTHTNIDSLERHNQ